MDPSYNNSFGNGAPVSYGTGDIILAPDDNSSGKSRKGLVIALVVLVVLLVGAGVGFAVWRGVSRDQFEEGSGISDLLEMLDINDYTDASNAFANYILFDKISIEKVDDSYNPGILYPIWRAAKEHDDVFLNNAKGLYDNMAKWIDSAIDAGLNDDIDDTLWDNYKNIFSFYYLYNTSNNASQEDIEKMFLADGYDKTAGYINDEYNDFEVSSDLAKSYGELMKKSNLLLLDSMRLAKENGCITGGDSIDVECQKRIYEYKTAIERFQIEQLINSMVYDTRAEVVSNCFELVYSLKGDSRSDETSLEDERNE